MKRQPTNTASALALVLTLSACGGDGGPADPAAAPSSAAALESSNISLSAASPAPLTPGEIGASPFASPPPTLTPSAHGQQLRARMLTTLSGAAALSCGASGNSATETALTLTPASLTVGTVIRPVSELREFTVGQWRYHPAYYDGAGEQFVVQTLYETSDGWQRFELRFDRDGLLADVLIGVPQSAAGSAMNWRVASRCKPTGTATWNANARLRESPRASYQLVSERQATYSARALSCQAPAGAKSEAWQGAAWIENNVAKSSPRASRPNDPDYTFRFSDYLSAYTRIETDTRVHHGAIHPGDGIGYGFEISLGDSDLIESFKVIDRTGAPTTQVCSKV